MCLESTTEPPQNCLPLLIIAACQTIKFIPNPNIQSYPENIQIPDSHHEGKLVRPSYLPVDNPGPNEPLATIAVNLRLDRILLLVVLLPFELTLLAIYNDVFGGIAGGPAVRPGATDAEDLFRDN